MSVYDSNDLMSLKSAAREYDIPQTMIELAISQGSLRVIEEDGSRWLRRPDLEQFVKRTIKRGAGTKVVTRLNP